MDKRFVAIADQLLLIERELRVLGHWSEISPSVEALASVEPFCVDTLEFEQWLQWIFLPRMKQILEENLPLPNASGILAMAQMVYASRPGHGVGLQQLLAQFDELISNAG